MEPGAFSVSLAIKDLQASGAFTKTGICEIRWRGVTKDMDTEQEVLEGESGPAGWTDKCTFGA